MKYGMLTETSAQVLVAALPIALAACTSGDGRAANADAGKGGVSLAEAGGESAAADGPAAADALGDDAPIACANALDCRSVSQASLSTFCCMDKACTLDTPGSCTDANVQLIQASSYDQSCTKDGDCMWVTQGNACHLLGCGDPGAINMRSYAQYQSDFAKTRGASCVAPQGDCFQLVTCCRSGSCRIGDQCNGGDASAE